MSVRYMQGPADTQEGWRADALLVARESNTSALPLLLGMILQTLGQFRDLPGRAALAAAGLDPLMYPSRWRAQTFRRGGTRAVLFCVEGTWCLYSMGSAAQTDVDKDNGFVTILEEVLDQLRPRDVYIATFSRLVRSSDFSGTIQAAMKRNRCRLHCREMTIDLCRDPMAGQMWQFLGIFSAMERDMIVTRLVLGTLHRFRTTGWYLPASCLPYGYKLVGKRVVIDEAARPLVRRLCELLADPALTSTQIVVELVRHGLVLPGQRRAQARRRQRAAPEAAWTTGAVAPEEANAHATGRAGDVDEEEAPAADDDMGEAGWLETHVEGGGLDASGGGTLTPTEVRRLCAPEALVARMRGMLELLATGRTTRYLSSPVEGVPSYAEFPVVPDPRPGRKGRDAIELQVVLPLPAEGWAPPEVLAAARAGSARHLMANAPMPGRQDRRLPLLGKRLSEHRVGGYWYRLLASASSYPGYVLQRQAVAPGEDPPAGPTWYAGGQRLGEPVVRVGSAELNAGVADGVADYLVSEAELSLEAIDGGEGFRELTLDHSIRFGAREQAAMIRKDLSTAEAAMERARRRLKRYDERPDEDADTERIIEADLVERVAQVRDLQAALAEAEARAEEEQQSLPDAFDSPAALVLACLAGLRQTAGSGSVAMSKALNAVLADLRLAPDGLRVRWWVRVRLPVDGGVLVSEPITGTVRSLYLRTASANRGRVDASLAAFMTTDTPLLELLDSREYSGHAERGRYRDRLEAMGLARVAANAVLNVAVPDTRSILWSLLHNEAPPGYLDPGFVQVVGQTFMGTDPVVRQPNWLRPSSVRQFLVEYLLPRGGRAPRAELTAALAAAGLRSTLIGDLSRISSGTRRAHYQRFLAVPALPCPAGGSRWNCGTDCVWHGLISLLPCACGGWVSHPMSVPECRSLALCPDCLRAPGLEAVYPEMYRLVTPSWYEDWQRRNAPELLDAPGGAHVGALARAWGLKHMPEDCPQTGTIPQGVIRGFLADPAAAAATRATPLGHAVAYRHG